LEELR